MNNMTNSNEPSDGQKLEMVLKSMHLVPAISSILGEKLLRELMKKGPDGLDNDFFEVLQQQIPAIQSIFAIAGLSMLIRSNNMIADGWQPSEKDIELLKEYEVDPKYYEKNKESDGFDESSFFQADDSSNPSDSLFFS